MNTSNRFHTIRQALVVGVMIGWGGPLARAEDSPAAPRPFSGSVIAVYRASCLDCHDGDGRGQVIRDLFPKVPDFTDPKWQASRTDAELSRVILEGKGKSMPQMKTKLGPVDVVQMVKFVRAFQGGNLVIEDDNDAVTEADPPAVPALPQPAPPQARRPQTPAARPAPAARTVPPTMVAQRQPAPSASSRVFQQLCQRCHGDDGRGNAMRDHFAALPDFTVGAWHAHRTDAQLTVSILDGKGDTMPSFRGKVSHQQARELAAIVRAFGPVRVQPTAAGADEFDRKFHQLQQEVLDLKKQVQALSGPAPPSGEPQPAKRR